MLQDRLLVAVQMEALLIYIRSSCSQKLRNFRLSCVSVLVNLVNSECSLYTNSSHRNTIRSANVEQVAGFRQKFNRFSIFVSQIERSFFLQILEETTGQRLVLNLQASMRQLMTRVCISCMRTVPLLRKYKSTQQQARTQVYLWYSFV